MNGNQVYRKIPMFASWGHKFRISCTTCRVIVTTAGPNRGGGGRGGERRRGGGEAQGGPPDRRSHNTHVVRVVNDWVWGGLTSKNQNPGDREPSYYLK